MPQRHAAWVAERDNLVALLTGLGVEVQRPRLLTDSEKAQSKDGYSSFFVRDPFVVIGDDIIETSLRFKHRRNEFFTVRELLVKETATSDGQYVAVPRPSFFQNPDGTTEEGPFLEGGDIFILGNHIFVGESGLATDDSGFRWLKKYLSPKGYTVEKVRLAPDVLHLDCAMSFVRDGLAIVSEYALVDGIPESLQGWDLTKYQKKMSQIWRLMGSLSIVPGTSWTRLLSR